MADLLAEDENRAGARLSDSRLVDDELEDRFAVEMILARLTVLEGRWRVYLRRWGPEARRWQMVLGEPT